MKRQSTKKQPQVLKANKRVHYQSPSNAKVIMCLDNDDDDVTIGRCHSKNALLVDNPSKEDLRQEIFSLDNSDEEEDNVTIGPGGEERILTGDQEMKNRECVDENVAARGYIDECILNHNRKNDDDLSKLKWLEYTLYGEEERPIEWATTI
jgi:hypothetical protein